AAAADDGGIQFRELLQGVTELGRFVDSTGSVRFRIKIEDQIFVAIILQRDGYAAVVGHGEVRGLVACFEHLNSPRGLRAKFPAARAAQSRLRFTCWSGRRFGVVAAAVRLLA